MRKLFTWKYAHIWIVIISFVLLLDLSNYLDSKFYGYARAEQAENWDDSEWHWLNQQKRIQDMNPHVVYTFPDYDNDDTRLLVIHHQELDMYCYVLENKPYNFKTGLNCFPGWHIRGEHLK